MTAFHNNLALHISEATLKAQRRLEPASAARPRHLAMAVLGACAIWALALAFI
jgi:hypothetical protein